PMNKLIHQVEWWLTYESRRTITCSQYMRDQVRDIFQLPPTKLDVIPNGVDLEAFEVKSDLAAFRASVIPDGHKLVFFAGRLEYEKGVQTVLEALPALIKEMPVQFHIAGSGTHREELEKLTTRLELGEHVRFLGFLNESELANYYRAADLAVVPSLYEPFGMVALETMAAGTPLIVGDTGGLRELVSHGATGLRVAPGDPEAMLDALRRVLTDHRLARRIAMDARRRLTTEYSWASIARSTVNVYERAMAEEKFLRSTIREERVPLRVILGRSPLLAARSS
ncbi:MAG: glycosyltransferase family 4 protein, partial [Actinomycetota bacterium]